MILLKIQSHIDCEFGSICCKIAKSYFRSTCYLHAHRYIAIYRGSIEVSVFVKVNKQKSRQQKKITRTTMGSVRIGSDRISPMRAFENVTLLFHGHCQ